MRHCLAIVLTMSLAGCAKDQLGHEPEVRTVEAAKAVAVPCDPKLPPRPELLTKDQLRARLDTIPAFDDRLKAVMDQLLLHMGWVMVQDAAIDGCAHPK